MIAASLLYHAEEYVAFWLMQLLFEKLEMRDIFLPGTDRFIEGFLNFLLYSIFDYEGNRG